MFNKRVLGSNRCPRVLLQKATFFRWQMDQSPQVTEPGGFGVWAWVPVTRSWTVAGVLDPFSSTTYFLGGLAKKSPNLLCATHMALPTHLPKVTS